MGARETGITWFRVWEHEITAARQLARRKYVVSTSLIRADNTLLVKLTDQGIAEARRLRKAR